MITGSTVRQSHESQSDIQQHQSQHQCAKGLQSFYSGKVYLVKPFQQIFKIILAKAFDLKCTIPEIVNTGEPLLIYQNVA